VAVLDGVVENGGKRVDQLADRRRSERDDLPPAMIAELRSSGDRGPQVCGLADLVCLEGQAELRVNLVEPARREERQQMPAQAPEVVASGVFLDRPVAEHAVGPRLQPIGRVLVEGRNGPRRRGGLRRHSRMGRLAGPDAGVDARDDVAELSTRRPFVPATTTPAFARCAFVEGDALATAAGMKAKLVSAGAVGQRLGDHASGRYTGHERPLMRPLIAFIKAACAMSSGRARTPMVIS
jgi:hypothetical protein